MLKGILHKFSLHVKIKCAYHTNGVLLLHCRSANHLNKSVVGTPTVSYNTPLVWYAHFIF